MHVDGDEDGQKKNLLKNIMLIVAKLCGGRMEARAIKIFVGLRVLTPAPSFSILTSILLIFMVFVSQFYKKSSCFIYDASFAFFFYSHNIFLPSPAQWYIVKNRRENEKFSFTWLLQLFFSLFFHIHQVDLVF